MYLQINTVKYDADREITNLYENLKIVQSQFSPICYYSFILGLLWISIGLSVFRFIANEYKWIAIRSLLTIHNIWSGIRWTNPKVKKHYFPLPKWNNTLHIFVIKAYRGQLEVWNCSNNGKESGVNRALDAAYWLKASGFFFCQKITVVKKCSNLYYGLVASSSGW